MNGSLRSRTRWLLLASGIDPASNERVAGRGRWTGADEIVLEIDTSARINLCLPRTESVRKPSSLGVLRE
jgi:hypothetical protein